MMLVEEKYDENDSDSSVLYSLTEEVEPNAQMCAEIRFEYAE